MQIDFLGIQAFLAIAECGSFQAAAQRLNLSQTAVSHRMRKLEENVGVRLIERGTRDITLTEAGHALLPSARSAVRELAQTCEVVRRHGQHANRWLAFACLPTLAVALAAPLLAACRARWPDTPVRLFDTSVHEVAGLVESRAVCFGLSIAGAAGDELRVEHLADEAFVLVCPPDHPLAGQPRVPWTALHGEALIRISLPSGNSLTIDDALGPLRSTLRWRYEAQHNAMALEMVRAGLGLTVAPRLSVPPTMGLRLVEIEAPAVRRGICLLTRRDALLSDEEAWLRQQAVALLRDRLAAPPA